MSVVCKRCLLFSETDQGIQKTIEDYIAALDDEQKVEEKTYNKRLNECEICDALHGGMCKYCGCFVVIRAIKKKQKCPYPKKQKW